MPAPLPPSQPSDFDGLGTAFYPEQQPEADWQSYVRLMAECGLQFVRLGEFAWARLEPREGEYDFSLFDRVLDLLRRHGLKALMCTPCAAPPAWLCRQYDIHPLLPDGTVQTFGKRRHLCLNAPDFQRLADQLITAMARHYGGHPDIVGWQIDNEFGHPLCRCPRCLQLFSAACHTRFDTPAEFNRRLGLDFWSQSITAFDDLIYPLQLSHSAIALQFRRFHSDCVIACYGKQAARLRENGVTVPISTNYMVTWPGFDHEKMSKHFDYVAGDWYFGSEIFGSGLNGTLFACEFLRGLKDGLPPRFNEFRGFASAPGEVRAHTLAAIRRGARHILYFRWDCAPAGQERNDFAIVRRPENPGRAWHDIQAIAAELTQVRVTRQTPRTAILYAFEAHADFADNPSDDPRFAAPFGNGYPATLARQFEALESLGETTAIICPGGDFSRYELIIAPALSVLTDSLARKIRHYLEQGGTFLFLPGSARYNEDGLLFRNGAPGPLADLFGVTCADSPKAWPALRFHSSLFPECAVTGEFDELQPDGADILATYSHGPAAMTRHGNAFCLGTWPDDLPAFYQTFLSASRTPATPPPA